MSDHRPTLLLAEANPDLREAVTEMLTALGYSVVAVRSGREAVARVRGGTEPELLVTDAHLADMTGLELIDLLRRQRPLRALVLSSFGESGGLRHRSRQGDVGFLAVPFSSERLGDAVRRALSSAAPAIATPPRPRPRRLGSRAWGLAAAALAAVLVAAIPFLDAGPPPLRPPGAADAARGAQLEVVAPRGELSTRPPALEWLEVTGAAAYRVRLGTADQTILWEGETAATAVPLPDELSNRIQPAVTYWWTVEALDGERNRVAWTARQRFQMRPEGTPEP